MTRTASRRLSRAWGAAMALALLAPATAQAAGDAAAAAAPAARAADAARTAQEQVVHRFLKAWETGDRAAFADALDPEVEFAYPGGRLNRDELLALFDSYRAEKTAIRIYLWEQFLVSGDQFATAYQFAATDRRTGKRQAVGTGVTGRVRNGKIVLFKEYYDEEVATLQYADKLPLDEGQVSPWPASIWLRIDKIN